MAFFDNEKIDIEGKTYGFGMNKRGYRDVSVAPTRVTTLSTLIFCLIRSQKSEFLSF